jgi:hypothetical protein
MRASQDGNSKCDDQPIVDLLRARGTYGEGLVRLAHLIHEGGGFGLADVAKLLIWRRIWFLKPIRAADWSLPRPP